MNFNCVTQPTLKQKQPFVVHYLCQILRKNHFQNAFLNANSILHWLLMQKFNLETWDGFLLIPVHYFVSNYSFTHSYLEQLWFRLQSKNAHFHKYFLIPSICILDILEAISIIHKEFIVNEGLTRRKKRRLNHQSMNNISRSMHMNPMIHRRNDIKSTADDEKIPEPPKFVPFPMENFFASPSSLFPNINPFSADISSSRHSLEISPMSKHCILISDTNSRSTKSGMHSTSDELILETVETTKKINVQQKPKKHSNNHSRSHNHKHKHSNNHKHRTIHKKTKKKKSPSKIIGASANTSGNIQKSKYTLSELQQINAVCICSRQLIAMTTSRASDIMKVDGFECDGCNNSLRISLRRYLFHCPNNEAIQHKDGFDLCVTCALSKSQSKDTTPSSLSKSNDQNLLSISKSIAGVSVSAKTTKKTPVVHMPPILSLFNAQIPLPISPLNTIPNGHSSNNENTCTNVNIHHPNVLPYFRDSNSITITVPQIQSTAVGNGGVLKMNSMPRLIPDMLNMKVDTSVSDADGDKNEKKKKKKKKKKKRSKMESGNVTNITNITNTTNTINHQNPAANMFVMPFSGSVDRVTTMKMRSMNNMNILSSINPYANIPFNTLLTVDTALLSNNNGNTLTQSGMRNMSCNLNMPSDLHFCNNAFPRIVSNPTAKLVKHK